MTTKTDIDLNDTSKMDNWKQFQGTELGSLMSQIYGNQKPIIEYPKPKVMKPFEPNQKYMPGKSISSPSSSSSSSSSLSALRRNVKVKVPKLSGKSSGSTIEVNSTPVPSLCAVDYIPRRKPQDVIVKEIDNIKMKQTYYRPAHIKPISTDMEKDRLSQIFEYKGGKILPNELTNMVSEAPFEVIEKQRERSRIEAIKIKRGLSKPITIKTTLSPTEQLAEQIASEIEERRQYLNDMKQNGTLSRAEENRVMTEISKRVDELKWIDS